METQQEDGVKSFFSQLEPFSLLARKTSEVSLSFWSASGLLHSRFFGFSLVLPHRLVAPGVGTIGASVSCLSWEGFTRPLVGPKGNTLLMEHLQEKTSFCLHDCRSQQNFRTVQLSTQSLVSFLTPDPLSA